MGKWRVCIVAALVGVALAAGLVLVSREASAADSHKFKAEPQATFPPPTITWPTPSFELPEIEPFEFIMTDTRVYSGFWTFDRYWGTLGLAQQASIFLNQYHIINLVVVFFSAATVMALLVRVVIKKLFSGK